MRHRRRSAWSLKSFDTNVAARLVVLDDPAQCERAAQAFRRAIANGGVSMKSMSISTLARVVPILLLVMNCGRAVSAEDRFDPMMDASSTEDRAENMDALQSQDIARDIAIDGGHPCGTFFCNEPRYYCCPRTSSRRCPSDVIGCERYLYDRDFMCLPACRCGQAWTDPHSGCYIPPPVEDAG